MNTTSPKSRFAKFLKQFQFEASLNRPIDGSRHVTWHGNVGYIDLGPSLTIARIELSDLPSKGHFSQFEVRIIHRVNGVLDALTFKFNDFFTKEDRIDDRISDLPNQTFHAWEHKGSIEWYIAVPRSTSAIVEAVNAYLNLWCKGPR